MVQSTSSQRGRDGGRPALLDPASTDPDERDRLLQWLRVQTVFAYRPQDASPALCAGAPPEALWRAARVGARADAARLRIGDARWRALEACGARGLPITSPAYPERLRRLADAPPLLWVQGDPAHLAARGVAVVGARAATAYGRRIASAIADALARAGVVVVSGLARGIDACAHAGALEAGGATVAIQGRGADGVYPRAHEALARRIRSSGALVTEFPPGTPPLAAHFPLRNRIISALSDAVVVVEARARSGSLVTARHASDQGVDVLAVPGPIDAPTSEGPNGLLREGAGAVLGPPDVLAALGLEALEAPQKGPRRRLEAPARRVVEALGERPATRDELARRLGLAPESLALSLAELEIEGWIEPGHDGRLRLVRSR